MDLPEPVGGLPRIMGVAQNDALTAGGHVTSEGPGVAAQPEVIFRRRQAKAGMFIVSSPDRRRRRRCACDLAQPAAGPDLDHLLLVQAQEIVHGGRPDPGGVPAGGRSPVRRRVPQISVVAGDIPANEGAIFGREGLSCGPQRRHVHLRLEEDVAFQIRHWGKGDRCRSLCAEILRALARECDELVGQETQVVLCEGIARPVAQPAEVAGEDVRDAVARPPDLGAIVRLGARRRGEEHPDSRHESRDEYWSNGRHFSSPTFL